MDILGRLKSVRKGLGLTQEEFALRIGLKKGSYANIESGNDPLVDRTVNAIRLAFPNVSSEYLMYGKGAPLAADEGGGRTPVAQRVVRVQKVVNKEVVKRVEGGGEVVEVLRELLRAKDQIIAEKERQVQLLEMLLARN